jgi:Bacterial Ig domain
LILRPVRQVVNDGTLRPLPAAALLCNIQRTFFNRTPNAAADTATTEEITPTVIDVLGNDADPDDGDTLTVTAVTQPANGTVVINDDGTLTYTPDEGFVGDDTFSHTVSDEESWPPEGPPLFAT